MPPFCHAEEQVFKDAQVPQLQKTVIDEQFRQLSATLNVKQKPGSSSTVGSFSGAAVSLAEAPLEASIQSLVLAMLAMGGATGSGGEANHTDMDDWAAKLSKACEQLGRQHQNNTALTFALRASGVCSLLWSTMRKRSKQAMKASQGQLQEMHRWLQMDFADVKDMEAHWKKYCKTDCLRQAKRILEEAVYAWSQLESYFSLQRQFMQQLNQSATSDDLRLFLFASFRSA
eukprot:CAMPEP_0115336406 /NCGR_PEP_ID=MMETSP0270-20121206/88989_1 /TAXON_ID=71861 /ORGANISM="Scrippsiella trochoidea, Strain CCMP3099" /LENGTH=229 /DNA_ID=CAMNT_0002757577 /DNA_START=97 /DNA_END=782 /DNA_ORIENTATION=-